MIRNELKPVCMGCDHADVEVEEVAFCGFAPGASETVVRCSHAAVCRMVSAPPVACQRAANGDGAGTASEGGEGPRQEPMAGPFPFGM